MVPFNRPNVSERSRAYVLESLGRDRISGDGPFSARTAAELATLTGSQQILLTPSCTSALEISMLLAEIGPGDEVIMPSFNFTSSALAVANLGAVPVFIDIDPEHKGITKCGVEQALSSRTKAVVAVNYAGVACGLAAIADLCVQNEILLIEDNAHGLGGRAQDERPLGTFGQLATYSFHETKNLHCGEGGALALNDLELIERAEILREKGTDRSRFFRGMVDKYQWVDLGTSGLLADPLAAVLLGQIEDFEVIHESRRTSWNYYRRELLDWAHEANFEVPIEAPESQNLAHIFYLVAPNAAHRDSFLKHMTGQGISAVIHYQALHSSTAGSRFGRPSGSLSESTRLSDCLLRLPLFVGMSQKELDEVVVAAKKWNSSFIA